MKRRDLSVVPFKVNCIKNITNSQDEENGRRVYVGHTLIPAIIGLSTDENVRDFLLDAEGRKKRKSTQVHRAIADTLVNNSENFSVLNSGLVIIARACNMNPGEKGVVYLKKPSIINGAQTQGIIKNFIKDNEERIDFSTWECFIKFELVVTDDEDLIAEISIARNYQNEVKPISIVGRRGYLDELEKSLKDSNAYAKLQKSETDFSDDYLPSERLIQVITALVPEELWLKPSDGNKVHTYSQKAKCLRDFQELFKKANNFQGPEYEKYKALYQFYLDIAPQAWDLYMKWKNHQGFKGTKLRSLKREGSDIMEIPDGIIFPILASFSAFASKQNNKWRINIPQEFDERDFIHESVKVAYMEMADSDPQKMGKNKSCYSSLQQLTSLYKKLSK